MSERAPRTALPEATEWSSLLKLVVTRLEGMGYASDSPEAIHMLTLLAGAKETAQALEEAGVPNALNVGAELLQSQLQEFGLRRTSAIRCAVPPDRGLFG